MRQRRRAGRLGVNRQDCSRLLGGTLLALTLCLGAAAPAVHAQQPVQPQLGRSVHGQVLNARNQPIPSAIVYLKNRRTKVIHTAIADEHGAYSFHQLSPNVGYELYAEWKGKRSPARVDSEYETQPNVRMDLKIPVAARGSA